MRDVYTIEIHEAHLLTNLLPSWSIHYTSTVFIDWQFWCRQIIHRSNLRRGRWVTVSSITSCIKSHWPQATSSFTYLSTCSPIAWDSLWIVLHHHHWRRFQGQWLYSSNPPYSHPALLNWPQPSFIYLPTHPLQIRTCKWIDKQSSSTKTCKLQIWDTAGQERFRAIVTSYYRGAHGVILTYDLTDPKSLHGIEQIWLPEIDRYAHQNARLVLVGNKSDLAKHPHNASAVETTRMLAKDFDDRYQERIAAHIETSAKLGANVEHAFQALIDAMMVDRKRQKSGQGRGGGGGGGSGVTHRLSSSLPLGGRGDARERSSCMCWVLGGVKVAAHPLLYLLYITSPR